MDLHKIVAFIAAFYPIPFLFGYLYSVNAFFEAARKYDADFYGLLGRPHIVQNNTYETLELFLRCMWFKRYFGRDRRVVAKAKMVRTSFFVFLAAMIIYPLVQRCVAG